MKKMASLLGIIVLLAPPLPAQAQSIKLSVCGEAARTISVPLKEHLPGNGDDHGCCKKGCHAANDRRKRMNEVMADNDCC